VLTILQLSSIVAIWFILIIPVATQEANQKVNQLFSQKATQEANQKVNQLFSQKATQEANQKIDQSEAQLDKLIQDWATEITLLILGGLLALVQKRQWSLTREELIKLIIPYTVNIKHDYDIQASLHIVMGATNADRVTLGIYKNGEIGPTGYHFQKITFDAEVTNRGFATAHLGDTWPVSLLLSLGLNLDNKGPWILPNTESGLHYLMQNRITEAWFFPIISNKVNLGIVVAQFSTKPQVNIDSLPVAIAIQNVQEAIEVKVKKSNKN
jgi:hypothetical protein